MAKLHAGHLQVLEAESPASNLNQRDISLLPSAFAGYIAHITALRKP